MRSTAEALDLAINFHPSPEDEKSRELVLALLEQTEAPFSRQQFQPGHITCTAMVLHPDHQRILLIYHRRLRRWLLPGGHVEETDVRLADTACREAFEETNVRIAAASTVQLVGMDVHAIPPHKHEPFHLHHDLIFAMDAESEVIERTEEAPDSIWCTQEELDNYSLPRNILRAALRTPIYNG
jgi:8-oxo-dGTP pyrophosphatase MutT (NUDIX family)